MPDYTQYGGFVFGTPLEIFNMTQAIEQANASGEDTRLGQMTKALAYWQNIAATSTNPNQVARANTYAIPWLTAEIARVSNPPANSLHLVYPV